MPDSNHDPDLADDVTRETDEEAAHIAAGARTEDEAAAAAAAGTEVPESVADGYQEAAETGAHGDGQTS